MGRSERDSCAFFFSSRRRHTSWPRDWSSDVCSSDLYSDSAAIDAYAAIANVPRALAQKTRDEFYPKESLQLRSEEHTSELQSRGHLVCRLLLEKKNRPYHTSATPL